MFDKRPIGSHENFEQPQEIPSRKMRILKKALRLFPTSREEFRTRKISVLFASVIVIVAIFFISKVISTAVFYATNFSASDLFFIFAGKVTQDEMHRTNILLVGTGDAGHDAPDLTDTIIVASYNHTTKIASMLSIPRDLYIRIPGYGSSRINKIYENLKPQHGSQRALEALRDSAQEVVNLDIHYYIKVDFQGFKDVVDILDGVDVEVLKAIYDTSYPDNNYGYEVFHIEVGPQHLDGETALKYARSRYTTSDFDRSQRQQQLLVAMKSKAIEKRIFISPMKIQELWNAFRENIETDMPFREMLAFARIIKNFDTSKIVNKVLRDIEIVQEGGFLYTPERVLYGGAFVLRPWGENYSDIHKYTQLIFETPEVFLENAAIEIQNGSGVSGAASKLMDYLVTYGFRVVRVGNTSDQKNYEKTHFTAVDKEQSSWTLQLLPEFLPKGIQANMFDIEPLSDASEVIIMIGKDFPLAY